MPIWISSPAGSIELRPGHPPLLWADGVDDPGAWAARQRPALRAAVDARGALWVRGLGLSGIDDVEAVFSALGDLVVEREAFAPRQRLGQALYSASRWPPRQPMCLHHELSYVQAFPTLLMVACLEAPAQGGATLLADAAAVLEALPPALVAPFERLGWMLQRHYGGEVGTTLAESFGVADPAAVERYCQAHAIEHEWLANGGLRTRQRCAAVLRHPLSRRRCWFNQIAFLSAWAMEAELRDYLAEQQGPDNLPFDTRYGDGTPIAAETVRQINQVCDSLAVRTAWQQGDLLLVDNLTMAHGREAYAGPRELVVAMADAWTGPPLRPEAP